MSNIKNYKTGEITQILEGIYSNPKLRRTIVPLFMSDPGRGKTHTIRNFMKSKGCDKPAFVLSQRMPFEVSGMALVDKESNFMKYYDFDFFLNLEDGDILFCDETFNANPLTLSAFLTFLEDRIMISGKQLPNIMIIAAANPQGKPVITPQINRRFLIYDIVFDAPYWQKYMLDTYSMPENVSTKLCRLIQDEKFAMYNYNTEADFDKAVEMIINKVPTPYEAELTPILETLIENPLDEEVVLSETRTLAPKESISWLDMARISRGIEVEDVESEVKKAYKITFLNCGDTKHRIIVKGLVEQLGLDQNKATRLVQGGAFVIKTNLDYHEALLISEELRRLGANIEINKNK